VLSIIALRQITQRGERGRGLAIASLIIGILGVIFFAIVVLGLILAAAHQANAGG